MAAKGRKFKFHGAYGTKSKAVRKEKRVGGFIRRTRINGHVRYLVLTRKG